MTGGSTWCWAPAVADDVSNLISLPLQVVHLAPAQAELLRLLWLSGAIMYC